MVLSGCGIVFLIPAAVSAGWFIVWLWDGFPHTCCCICWLVYSSVWLWDGFLHTCCCICWLVYSSVWLWDGFLHTCCCICWLVCSSVWLWDGFHQVFDRMSSIPVLDLMQASICKWANCMDRAYLCTITEFYSAAKMHCSYKRENSLPCTLCNQCIHINTWTRRVQPRQNKNLLYQHDKPNEPTKERPLSSILFESHVHLSFNTQQGHPCGLYKSL